MSSETIECAIRGRIVSSKCRQCDVHSCQQRTFTYEPPISITFTPDELLDLISFYRCARHMGMGRYQIFDKLQRELAESQGMRAHMENVNRRQE